MRNDIVVPFLHGQYALEMNYSIPCNESDEIFRYLAFTESSSNSEKVFQTITESSIIAYCLNDEVSKRASPGDIKKQTEYFKEQLEILYPEPTPFELKK
ncbi:hypothetical protein QTN25_007831 [Entamoeba marina]